MSEDKKARHDVVNLLRGNVGETVNLMLLRNGTVFNEIVARELIDDSTVESTVVPNGTTVITISGFNDSTPSQLQLALQQSAQSNPNGVVLDLRQNPGGSLNAMLDTLAFMVPDKTRVAIAVYRSGKEEQLHTKGNPIFSAVPLAILVDGNTACGAEMMAETLKTTLGGIIVGSQTLGKWNTQTLEEFPNQFAMKYTIATLKGAKGEIFDGVGITPDIIVQPKKDQFLEASRRLSEFSERLQKDSVLSKAISVLKAK